MSAPRHHTPCEPVDADARLDEAVAQLAPASPHLRAAWGAAWAARRGNETDVGAGERRLEARVHDCHGNLRARAHFVVGRAMGRPILSLPGESRPGGGIVAARDAADARAAGMRIARAVAHPPPTTPRTRNAASPIALVTGQLLEGDERDEAFVEGLAAAVAGPATPCTRVVRGISWRAVLDDGGVEGLLRRLHGASTVRRHRRGLRGLERDGLVIDAVPAAAIDAALLARCAAIQRDGPQAARGVVPVDDPEASGVLHALARRGAVRAWMARVGDEDAAFLIASAGPGLWRGEWTGYRDAFGRGGVGRAVLHRALEDAAEAGIARFDFGLGDAAYKRFWSEESRVIARLAVGLVPADGSRARRMESVALVAGLGARWRAERMPAVRRLAALPGVRRLTGFSGPVAVPATVAGPASATERRRAA